MPEESISTFPDAASLITAHGNKLPRPSRIETVAIDQALGRSVARDVLADRDQPPFHRSTRDGYAVRAADVTGNNRQLRVLGQLRAGQPPFTETIRPGEALEIMTGAPIPPGADAVLMVEHAVASHHLPSEGRVTLEPQPGRALHAGDNIVPAGAEAKAGTVILPAGTRLTPMHIGAAVSCGLEEIQVFGRPRIAILATGDELVEPGAVALEYQVRNSNSYSLAAQVERAGGMPVRLPIVRDSLLDLREALAQAMQCDLILLSGGVSMGKFDFVEQVLTMLGAEFFFTGVHMQPGRPVVFGQLPDVDTARYFFGLPGNPVSTMVTFALFAAPLIRALGGEISPQPLFARATLSEPFVHKTGLTRFLPAHLDCAWNHAEVTPVPWQGSGDLAAVARSNCFVVISPHQGRVETGEEVSVLLAYSC